MEHHRQQANKARHQDIPLQEHHKAPGGQVKAQLPHHRHHDGAAEQALHDMRRQHCPDMRHTPPRGDHRPDKRCDSQHAARAQQHQEAIHHTRPLRQHMDPREYRRAGSETDRGDIRRQPGQHLVHRRQIPVQSLFPPEALQPPTDRDRPHEMGHARQPRTPVGISARDIPNRDIQRRQQPQGLSDTRGEDITGKVRLHVKGIRLLRGLASHDMDRHKARRDIPPHTTGGRDIPRGEFPQGARRTARQ